tara:strand:+ start:218 stop:1138 length:921 start_codon:yes stop_codon:yes gene_type:complete
MKLIKEINTKTETKFIFDGGNLISRTDLNYQEDTGECFEYFLSQKIVQKPIKNIEISIIYEFEIEDHRLMYDDYFMSRISDFENTNPISKMAIKYSLVQTYDTTPYGHCIYFDPNFWVTKHQDDIINYFFQSKLLEKIEAISFDSPLEYIYYQDNEYNQSYVKPEDHLEGENMIKMNITFEEIIGEEMRSKFKYSNGEEMSIIQNDDVIIQMFKNPNWKYLSHWDYDHFKDLGSEDPNSRNSYLSRSQGRLFVKKALQALNNKDAVVEYFSDVLMCLNKGGISIWFDKRQHHDKLEIEQLAEFVNN